MARSVVQLHKALERAIADGHPWVYRDALRRNDQATKPGAVLDLRDRRGRFLARGIAESGPIALRVWSGRADRPIDADLFAARLRQAIELRSDLALPETTAMRWVHGEGDRMPGMVCDRYDELLVVKWDGDGIVEHASTILDRLAELARERGVTKAIVRRGRGADKQFDVAFGSAPDGESEVLERGMKLLVDPVHGQKTGLFLDHRESRAEVRRLAKDRRVLNLYGYTGGFSIAAGLGGAREVTTVDQSEPAIDLARRGWTHNGLDPRRHRVVVADVREFLANDERSYDLVIADPPSFAPNQRSLDNALAAYRNLHRAALERVEDGGVYLGASCSAHVARPSFEATLRDAARGLRRHLQVMGRWGAGADHPVPLGFAEGEYLTAVCARVSSR